MKKKKQQNKTMLALFAFATIAILGVAGFAAAYGGGLGFSDDMTEEQLAEMQEHREAMQEALDNEDYDAWETLMNERVQKMQDQITEEGFQQALERHKINSEIRDAMQEARETGDFSEVQALKEQYGIEDPRTGQKFGKGMRGGMGMQNGNCENLAE